METICYLIDNLCKLKCLTNNENIEIVKSLSSSVWTLSYCITMNTWKKFLTVHSSCKSLPNPSFKKICKLKQRIQSCFKKQTQSRNKLQDVQYITKRIEQEFIHIFYHQDSLRLEYKEVHYFDIIHVYSNLIQSYIYVRLLRFSSQLIVVLHNGLRNVSFEVEWI